MNNLRIKRCEIHNVPLQESYCEEGQDAQGVCPVCESLREADSEKALAKAEAEAEKIKIVDSSLPKGSWLWSWLFRTHCQIDSESAHWFKIIGNKYYPIKSKPMARNW